jgi:hypothetical protein
VWDRDIILLFILAFKYSQQDVWSKYILLFWCPSKCETPSSALFGLYVNPAVADSVIWSTGRVFSFPTRASLNPWRQYTQVPRLIYKSPPLVPNLSQLDPLYTPPAYLPKSHSEPILPSASWFSNWSLSFWLSYQNVVHFPLLSHACHMSRPPHFPWCDVLNTILGWVQNMKLFIALKAD